MVKNICPPSNKCNGYPDPLVFPDVNEISFYVSSRSDIQDEHCDFGCSALRETMCYLFCEEILNGGPADDELDSQIACSLIMSNNDYKRRSCETNFANPAQLSLSNWSEIVDQQKPVVLLCHGVLSWRNQWLIHNLAAKLSRSLDCHTLRFDFSGNGHSLGEWGYSNYDVELNGLKKVVWYVENTMRCKVICIIGHSKGAASVLRFAWEQDSQERQPKKSSEKVPCFVNLAGRFTLPESNPSCLATFSIEQRRQLEETGKVHLTTRGSRKFIVTREDIEERSKQDMRHVSLITSSVLTVHGDQDRTVSVDNAFQFDSAIKNHEICIIQGADHNFSGSTNMEKLEVVISKFIREQANK